MPHDLPLPNYRRPDVDSRFEFEPDGERAVTLSYTDLTDGQKRYRDEKSGQWKTTTYFRPDELPKLALVATKAYEHLTLRMFDTEAVNTAGSK